MNSFIIFDIVTAGSRHLLEDSDFNKAVDDAQKEFNSFIDGVWGGKCVSDDQCVNFIGYCDKTQGVSSGALGALGDFYFF